jgi:hypothetical protein
VVWLDAGVQDRYVDVRAREGGVAQTGPLVHLHAIDAGRHLTERVDLMVRLDERDAGVARDAGRGLIAHTRGIALEGVFVDMTHDG